MFLSVEGNSRIGRGGGREEHAGEPALDQAVRDSYRLREEAVPYLVVMGVLREKPLARFPRGVPVLRPAHENRHETVMKPSWQLDYPDYTHVQAVSSAQVHLPVCFGAGIRQDAVYFLGSPVALLDRPRVRKSKPTALPGLLLAHTLVQVRVFLAATWVVGVPPP